MHRRADALRVAVRPGRESILGPAVERLQARRRSNPWWESFSASWQFAASVVSWPQRMLRVRWVRRITLAAASVGTLFLLAVGVLWFLLANGPISLDIATPWLTAAIAENFGNQFRVEVGGTVLERDEHGRTAMRILGITLRDHDGAVIASAPKAEVGFSSASLLSGRPRAERLNLVGAELSVRVEPDGEVSVSTGAERRALGTPVPLANPVQPAAGGTRSASERSAEPKRSVQEGFAAFLAWIDSLGGLGLDGADLAEVGLKSGNLVVDDRRNGQQSRFENIHLSLTRPRAGVLEFELGSEDATRPWQLTASVKPAGYGLRSVDLDARKINLRDLLLALRLDDGQIHADVPITAALRADIAQDGTPQFAAGRVQLGPGVFADARDEASRFAIDRADVSIDWNAEQGVLAMPFQVVSGATRMTLTARLDAPRDAGGIWSINLGGGSVVLAPTSQSEEALLLNRVVMRGRFDPVARRLDIDQAEASGKGVSVAMSGNLDFSGPDPRLAVGLAARNISAAAFRQMWPPFVNPPVRSWILERTAGGVIEQGEIATNAPISSFRSSGPPVPDDGLSIQITPAAQHCIRSTTCQRYATPTW